MAKEEHTISCQAQDNDREEELRRAQGKHEVGCHLDGIFRSRRSKVKIIFFEVVKEK